MGSFNQIQPVPQVGGTVHQQMLHRLFARRMLPNFGDYWKEFLVCFLVSNMNLLRVFLNPQNFPETRIAHEKTPSQRGIIWCFSLSVSPFVGNFTSQKLLGSLSMIRSNGLETNKSVETTEVGWFTYPTWRHRFYLSSSRNTFPSSPPRCVCHGNPWRSMIVLPCIVVHG